ncbi:hypothetical protein ETAA8_31300 [Anatilimnocola aggregata]|uniref:Uncharacterized protein n=1 Tax=Anatilimnocola aggregata TaxID=2528021 RepID=A0A517YCU1_9BACT|nr:hypothetical protein ETAA8_31300 [Anatilimnocola aggregata]
MSRILICAQPLFSLRGHPYTAGMESSELTLEQVELLLEQELSSLSRYAQLAKRMRDRGFGGTDELVRRFEVRCWPSRFTCLLTAPGWLTRMIPTSNSCDHPWCCSR